MTKLGNCRTCSDAKARYACPACAWPSCSLQCAKGHKTKTVPPCTGIAPAHHTVAISANDYSWGALMRDQAYISGVSRFAEEKGRMLAGEKLVPQARSWGGEGRLDDRTEKEEALVRHARDDGVELVLLSRGMSKRTRNSSRWDPKEKRMEWTIDLALRPPSAAEPAGTAVVTSSNINATTTVAKALRIISDLKAWRAKSRDLPPAEAAWRAQQKAWIDSLDVTGSVPPPPMARVEEAATHSEASDVANTMVAGPSETLAANNSQGMAPTSSVADSAAPFSVLLACPLIPSRVGTSEESQVSAPPHVPLYHLLSTSATLREALRGTTLLEYPLLELWSTEEWETALEERRVALASRRDDAAAAVDRGGRGANANRWSRGGSHSSRDGPGDRPSGRFGTRTTERSRANEGEKTPTGWQSGVGDAGWGSRGAKREVDDVVSDTADPAANSRAKSSRAGPEVDSAAQAADSTGQLTPAEPDLTAELCDTTALLGASSASVSVPVNLPGVSRSAVGLVHYDSD